MSGSRLLVLRSRPLLACCSVWALIGCGSDGAARVGGLPRFSTETDGLSDPSAAGVAPGGASGAAATAQRDSASSESDPAPGNDPSGEGAATSAGGAGTPGDGSGDDVSGPTPEPRRAGGDFVVSNAWRGSAYLVSDAGTSYEPSGFAARQPGEALCARGVVRADPGFGSFFELGIHLNQPAQSALPAAVSGAGLALRIKRNLPGPLRAQLVGPDSTVDNLRWCAELRSEPSQLVEYGAFNTACWNGSGQNYDSGPLRSVALVVPGSATSDTAFDFCIEAFADADSAGDAVLDGGAEP